MYVNCWLPRALPPLALAVVAAAAGLTPAGQDAPAERPGPTPWGVSSSASSFRDHAEWFPKVKAAGGSTVRLFPEWRTFEPRRGAWAWDAGDALVKSAAANGLEVTAVLMGSPPGSKAAHAFPVDDLDGWAGYVSAVVGRYGKQIRYWEVWNEGNGGFNDGRHTTADYARLAAVTYEAAKKADPRARVGLTVASFDAPYLREAIRAMAAAGKPGHFDYLCVHPYEIADGIADPDGEIPFLWMSRLLRDMLRRTAPDRADAGIWVTEIGRRVEERDGRAVTEEDAARGLVKMYTMAVAQGIACTQWFEAQDPAGEPPGFGLLRRDGSPRAAYTALKALTAALGAGPEYLGWLALGEGGRGYGFVFAGPAGPVLAAWAPAGVSDIVLKFTDGVDVTDPVAGQARKLGAGEPLKLTAAPVLVAGLPPDLVRQAGANAAKNFPWGGDYSAAKSVSCQPARPDAGGGVFVVGRDRFPVVEFPDGSAGILVQGDIGHPVNFYAHPSFQGLHAREYYVRVTVRRVAEGNVGMNLFYEVADSRGRSPYANVGQWFGTAARDGWQTHTWHVTDAGFSKMWGYDFSVRPEQSVPFVLGKVEVSTEPFRGP